MALPSVKRPGKGSLRNLDMLGGLVHEVTAMLDRSLEQRGLAAGMMDRAWERFEDVDAAIRAELAELPGDLDVYLRLVRDKKRFEARLRAQEAEAMQISHALNFHLGTAPPAGPSLMDELRAEQADLDAQATQFAMENESLDEGLLRASDGADGGGPVGGGGRGPRLRRKKRSGDKGGGDAQRQRSEAAVAEEKARERYNMRDGLFAHLEAGAAEELALEDALAEAPEGSVEALERETALAKFRARQAASVAGFMDAYAPTRTTRAQEESHDGLGLDLEDPAEAIARIEREASSFAAAAAAAASCGEGAGDNGGELGDGIFEGESEDGPAPSFSSADGAGGGMSRPNARGSPQLRGMFRNETGASKRGGGRRGEHAPMAIPGVGVAQRMSDRTVGDALNSRSILDLPAYGAHDGGGGGVRSPVPRGRGGGNGGDMNEIRGTVMDNTEDIDLAFPTLEFRRKKSVDAEARYYAPGTRPAPFAVSQSDGAVWSAMARERRTIEAAEREAGLAHRTEDPRAGGGGGGPLLPFAPSGHGGEPLIRPTSRPASREPSAFLDAGGGGFDRGERGGERGGGRGGGGGVTSMGAGFDFSEDDIGAGDELTPPLPLDGDDGGALGAGTTKKKKKKKTKKADGQGGSAPRIQRF